MNLTDTRAESANARAAERQTDQFTAARIAAVLGRDVRELRRVIGDRQPDGTTVVHGNVARTYLLSSLPEVIRTELAALATRRGYDSPERLLTRDDSRWEPPFGPAQIHPEEIAKAQKRHLALAACVRDLSRGVGTISEITAAAVAAHGKIVGFAVTAETVLNVMRRAITRDAGRCEWQRWELYLPEVPKRAHAAPSVADTAGDFLHFESYLVDVDFATPTIEQRSFAWTAMCDNLQQLLERGDNPRAARCALIRHVFAKAPWMSRSKQSLAKCFDEKWERYSAGENFVADRRPAKSGNFHALPLTDEDENKLISHALTGGIARAWRNALQRADLSCDVVQRYVSNGASKSYVPRRVRELLTPKVEMLQDIHHGPRQHRLNGAYITRDWSSVLPGDWYQSDDCTPPIYFWDIGADGRPRALRGQFLPMIDCKTTRILAFALHPERNYTARVIRGLILQTHDSYGLPRRGFYFENGIWKKSKLLKGVADVASGDEVPSEETERGLRDFVTFRHAQLPRGKVVEGTLGILQREMEALPGYVGRDEKTERFERVQKKLQLAARGHIEYSSFLLHRDDWSKRLDQLSENYNAERQDGRLNGLSPREAWDLEFTKGAPLVKLDGPARRLLANHRRPLRIGKNGLCVEIGRERHWFRSEATGRIIGETVQAYFNPEDMSSVWLERSTGEVLIVPKAPVLPAMDATAEQMKSAKASCEAHNRSAATLYRALAPHFSENTPPPFRATVVSTDFAEDSAHIEAEQAKIKARQGETDKKTRELTRYQRALGKMDGSDPVSNERRLAAYKLLEEANQDEQRT